MYIVKIGEDQVKVVDKQDVKTLNNVLIDLGCTERVTHKLVISDDDVKEVEND